MTKQQKADFESGYEDGNYCNAYVTQHYSEAASMLVGASKHFQAGHLLGFFASYELHEIDGYFGDQNLRELVEQRRSDFRECL